jgi:hypothetical protein
MIVKEDVRLINQMIRRVIKPRIINIDLIMVDVLVLRRMEVLVEDLVYLLRKKLR